MNSITITGNITRDAEVRFLQNGDPVAGFSVADNQGKDKPAIFWNCSLFGKRAESLSQYLAKGQPVTVIGTLSEREFTDKDGQKRKAQDVRVIDVALQGGKREGAAPAQQSKPVKYREGERTPSPSDFDDSDAPF